MFFYFASDTAAFSLDYKAKTVSFEHLQFKIRCTLGEGVQFLKAATLFGDCYAVHR